MNKFDEYQISRIGSSIEITEDDTDYNLEHESDNEATSNVYDSSDCVVIGVSGAGKTYFTIGVAQASHWQKAGFGPFQFLPKGHTRELVYNSIDLLTGESSDGVNYSDVHRFDIKTFPHSRAIVGRQPKRMSVGVYDAPGSALFSEHFDEHKAHWREAMLAAARDARVLVLCISITDPQLDMLVRGLPSLISLLSRDNDPETKPSMKDRVKNMWPKRAQWDRTLGVERLLLVFTRADIAVTQASQRIISDFEQGGESAPDWAYRPYELALRLEPITQAKSILGVPTLSRLDQALKQHTKFGVACISTGGFDALTGEPFLGQEGILDRSRYSSPDEILKRWRPFGIREVIQFIVDGRCRGSTREILPKHLASREG